MTTTKKTVQVTLTRNDDDQAVLQVVAEVDADNDEYTIAWETLPSDLMEALRYAEAYARSEGMFFVRSIANLI